jgi:hypothetical protein
MSGPLGVQYHEIHYTALITTSFALPARAQRVQRGPRKLRETGPGHQGESISFLGSD